MKEASLILPHQLLEDNPALKGDRKIFLFEAPVFFGTNPNRKLSFHKQKLIFHRASLKAYEIFLKEKGYNIEYIEYIDFETTRDFLASLKNRVETLHVIDPIDTLLQSYLDQEHYIDIQIYESPNFLNTKAEVFDYFANKKSYFQTAFYKQQRLKRNILIDTDGNPKGGEWTYDSKNRKKLPDEITVPDPIKHNTSEFVEEAKTYIKKHFIKNPGEIESFFYPIDFKHAKAWLYNFLNHQLKLFGPYQDAIEDKTPLLFHSALSPLINSGLLTPEFVVKETRSFSQKNNIPIESLEGFVRQIIGWREFMRAIYLLEGENQRESNFFNHSRKLTNHWYDGTTGIKPVDDVITKIHEYAYSHHIERLMVMGNIMLLCEIDPKEVYNWFMEMHIDSYDWVMVPNVFGMSQFADGGKIVTKPYFSSSNYITKMSNYKKGEWNDIWDGLFWRFIDKHQAFLSKNARMGFLVNTLKKMKSDRKKVIFQKAEYFIAKVTK